MFQKHSYHARSILQKIWKIFDENLENQIYLENYKNMENKNSPDLSIFSSFAGRSNQLHLNDTISSVVVLDGCESATVSLNDDCLIF